MPHVVCDVDSDNSQGSHSPGRWSTRLLITLSAADSCTMCGCSHLCQLVAAAAQRRQVRVAVRGGTRQTLLPLEQGACQRRRQQVQVRLEDLVGDGLRMCMGAVRRAPSPCAAVCREATRNGKQHGSDGRPTLTACQPALTGLCSQASRWGCSGGSWPSVSPARRLSRPPAMRSAVAGPLPHSSPSCRPAGGPPIDSSWLQHSGQLKRIGIMRHSYASIGGQDITVVVVEANVLGCSMLSTARCLRLLEFDTTLHVTPAAPGGSPQTACRRGRSRPAAGTAPRYHPAPAAPAPRSAPAPQDAMHHLPSSGRSDAAVQRIDAKLTAGL